MHNAYIRQDARKAKVLARAQPAARAVHTWNGCYLEWSGNSPDDESRLQVAVNRTLRVPGPAVQFHIGAGHKVDTGLAREEDQIKEQIAVFGLDSTARPVGTAFCKLIQQPLDVGKGHIRVFLGHQEPNRLEVGVMLVRV